MPARWALYRTMPTLWVALVSLCFDAAGALWLEGDHVTLLGLAYTSAQWGARIAGMVFLIAVSVFLVSRPRFLIYSALRSQPCLLKVWGNPGINPEGVPADGGQAGNY